MRIIAERTIRDFCDLHPQARAPLAAWICETKRSQWSCPQDVKRQYRTASFLANGRVVFNIKGNDYRLVVAINYTRQIVFIKFLGTHASYDHIDAEEVEWRVKNV